MNNLGRSSTPSSMDCGDRPIPRVGQENRVAIRGSDGDGEPRKVRDQRVAFAENAGTAGQKYQIRMDLFQTGNIVGNWSRVSGTKTVGDPGNCGEDWGFEMG